VREHLFLNVCGICSSVSEALKVMEKQHIDIIFSDIDMPGMNGLDFRRKMMDIPVCVFITAFPDYAVESFDVAAFDFLVKPINEERFNTTLERIKTYLAAKQKAKLYEHSLTTDADTIFIKEGHNYIKLALHDILYLEALKDYSLVVTAQKRFCVLSPIGNLLKENNFRNFVRIHRSFAVQKKLIDSITPQHVVVKNIPLPIGRGYKDNLLTLTSS
jgi:DNA-binding LytR/AlgR family response regulator